MLDFDLVIAKDLGQLLQLLGERPDSRVVAGATDFVPLVGAGKWKPKVAIDISRIEELRGIRYEREGLCIGPLTTHDEAATSVCIKREAQALAEACLSVADPLIRSRATLGGNLCTSSPAADSVPAMLAMGTELKLASLEGSRRMPLTDFLLGPGKNALRSGEIVERIDLPFPSPGSGSAFIKLGRRRAMAISVTNAAAWVHLEGGIIAEARIALGSVGPTVLRCRKAEAALRGRSLADLMALAPEGGIDEGEWLAIVREDISPIDDIRASGDYRRRVAVPLAQRAVERACERAELGL
jgi:xanthine dehydrogenase FAD-binding subunit